MSRWTAPDMLALHGRTAIITGTEGLGFECAQQLTKAGAYVILAGRHPNKGKAAVARIRDKVQGGKIWFEQVDLTDADSIADFSSRLNSQMMKLDILINGEEIGVPSERTETKAGIEVQFGSNYLGHFALTAGLLPLLKKSGDARVITLCSLAANNAVINFDEGNSARQYDPVIAYGQSKLACLMFALTLNQRSKFYGWNITSIAVHPGDIRPHHGADSAGRFSLTGFARAALPFIFPSAAQEALPALFAATSDKVRGGAYYGPESLDLAGDYISETPIPAAAQNKATRARLWNLAEDLTGKSYVNKDKVMAFGMFN